MKAGSSNILGSSDISGSSPLSEPYLSKAKTAAFQGHRAGARHRLSRRVEWAVLSAEALKRTGRAGEPAALSPLLAQVETAAGVCPVDFKGVYAEVTVSEHRLWLYALGWAAPTLMEGELIEGELSLLLILQPAANGYLPIGTELTLKEDYLLSSGQHLRWTNSPACLYTQIFGDWGTQFTVEVSVPNAGVLTMPPLTFRAAAPVA